MSHLHVRGMPVGLSCQTPPIWLNEILEREKTKSVEGNGGRRWSKLLSSPHLVFPSSSNTAPFPIVSNTAMIWDFLFTPMKSLPPGLNTVYISSWNRFFRSFPFSLPSARSLLSIIRVAEKKNNDYLHLRYRSFAFSFFFFWQPSGTIDHPSWRFIEGLEIFEIPRLSTMLQPSTRLSISK